MKKINWGIIGAGHIASSFVKALAADDKAVLYAVASRDKNRAESFTRVYGFAKSYAGADAYADLCSDKTVEAVYIATPHSNHAELSLMALKAGKAVLCEKPACVNAAELREVVEYSAEHRIFYMEALWMKFNPAVRRTFEAVRCGALGRLQGVQADFCIYVPYDIHHRLYNPLLAGGALLDTGIYPVSFAMLAAYAASNPLTESVPSRDQYGLLPYEGRVSIPSRLLSLARKSPSGVDVWNSILAEWTVAPHYTLAARLSSGNDIEGRGFSNNALLWGTQGKIILRNFWCAQEIEYYDEKNNLLKKEQYPFRVNGYEYEIEEMHRCLENGLYESPLHSHKDTLKIITTLDTLRAQWNLTYPCEKTVSETECSATPYKAKKGTGIRLYSDGACSGNPGPGGWAAVIYRDGEIITAQGGERPTTNNRMELSGAIGALEKLLSVPDARGKKITFYIDSQYVKNGISTWIHIWKQNGWKTSEKKPVKNKDLWEKLDLYTREFEIDWQWVKGHAGCTYNELCDTLAVAERNKRT